MKCAKAQKLINDQIDDLIDSGQARNLENHLERCGDCRDLLADMRSIVKNASELDCPDPSEGLWSGIKREILKRNRGVRTGEKGFRGSFRLYPKGPVLALSTLLAIVVLIPLLYYGLPAVRNADNAPGETALSGFQLAEQQYRSAIEILDQAIDARDAGLDPELMEVFKKNLAIIDESILACTKSINENPKVQETNKLLLICYRKKIELLNELKDMSMQS